MTKSEALKLKAGDIVVWCGILSDHTSNVLQGCSLFRLRRTPVPGDRMPVESPGRSKPWNMRIIDAYGTPNPNIRRATEDEEAKWALWALRNQEM